MKRVNLAFTLIEGLIALALIVLTVIFLMNVFPFTRGALQLSENHVNAAFFGRSLMDQARQTGFDALATSSGNVTFSGQDNGAPFSQVINYATSIYSVDTDEKRFWVTLTWHEKTGNKNLVLETLITKL